MAGTKQIRRKEMRLRKREFSWALLAILKILSFFMTEERSYQMISSKGITLCDSGFNRITLVAELRTGCKMAGKRHGTCGVLYADGSALVKRHKIVL